MPRGGWRPNAGRKAKKLDESGVVLSEKKAKKLEKPVKSTKTTEKAVIPADIAVASIRENKTPIEYMLDVMNDPKADNERRDRMAMAAAPFIHKKAGDAGKKDERGDAARKAVAGKFQPGAPPAKVVNISSGGK